MPHHRSFGAAFAALSVVAMIGCSKSPTVPSGVQAYPAFWINSYWTQAGQPGSVESVSPLNVPALYCPVNSLVMENHTTRYQSVFSWSADVLVFKNLCSERASLLVCASAGSGGNASEFPVCNVDARTTPVNRLASVDMGPNNSGIQSTTWRETGPSLSLNVFYCGIGDSFSLGAVSGANPTDCIRH